MPIAKATDVAFVRFAAPDLEEMQTFLEEFGLVKASRTEDRLHMTGRDGAPFIHATEIGNPAFLGFGFDLPDEDSLVALSRQSGAPIQPVTEPGGGKFVRLTDPDGVSVDAVYRERGKPHDLTLRSRINNARERVRHNAVSRVSAGPAEVYRLGHVVMHVSDYRRSQQWYHEHFGMLISDEIESEPGAALGAFLRCDRGATPVDHHSVFLLGVGRPGFNHAAFEVTDFDTLMAGHNLLKAKERAQEWGVGRHVLGSQIFDYWRDPWGHGLEHWTDGDLFDAEFGARKASVSELMGVQWGPNPPPSMGA